LTRGDLYVNSIRYLQECEGFRKDVVVLPLDLLATPWMAKAVKRWHPEIRLPAGGEGPHYLRSFLDMNREPEVFIPIPLLPGEREALKDGYQIWNVGFANKVLAIDQPFGFKDYLAASRVYSGYAPPGEGAVRGKPWATFVYEQY